MSSGFGLQSGNGGSIMNRTIGSSMHSAKKTAREFFSKDNMQHPSIEENRQLKDELQRIRDIKSATGKRNDYSERDVTSQMESYRSQF